MTAFPGRLAVRVPELSGAACRRPGARPELWFSRDRAEREAARHICAGCPVLDACREWAIETASSTDQNGSIVGGLGAGERYAERRRRKQAAELAELRQRSGMAAANKAKTHCGKCGEPLSGPNLMVVVDRNGGKHRRCRVCHRRRVASSRRLARRLKRQAQQVAA
jgi:Transcription factor WhiB